LRRFSVEPHRSHGLSAVIVLTNRCPALAMAAQ
jgi:hypothetical protein